MYPGPIYYCELCEDAEVENRGDVCADCHEKDEWEREHEGEGLHDTWEEARGEC